MSETVRVQIVDYSSQYKDHFKRLNVEWLEKYFYVEKFDNEVLSHPEKYVLKDGGAIFFSLYGSEIVGTAALIRQKDLFELSKMAVTEKCQGLKIGQKLAEAAIEKARNLGEKQIFLETNSKLAPAISLYHKLGFRHAEHPLGKSEHYQRADTYMILDL